MHKRCVNVIAAVVLCTGAFMAFSSTAGALESVEVVNEETGGHCPKLIIHSNPPPDVEGGCHIHFNAVVTARLDLGIFGEAHEATCNAEIEVRVAEPFDFYMEIDFSPGEANCTNDSSSVLVTCNSPWAGAAEEDGTTGIVQSTVSVCLNPAESSTDCIGNLNFNFAEQAGEHYEAQFNNSSVGLCELDMDAEVEDVPVTEDVTPHFNHL